MNPYSLEMARQKQAMYLAEVYHDVMVEEAKENQIKISLWQRLTYLLKTEPKKEVAKQY